MHLLGRNNIWRQYLPIIPCGIPMSSPISTVYPKKYAHGFCFAVLCCGYTLTDFPISIRLTSLALWQSNNCPSASKATLMNMDKYFMWIHYERLHNHNKAKHNKTVCIFLGIYCRQHERERQRERGRERYRERTISISDNQIGSLFMSVLHFPYSFSFLVKLECTKYDLTWG